MQNIVGKLPNQLNKCLAQTMIEFVLGVIVLFIFFAGALKVFVWVNKTMVERQENYELTRTLAGNNQIMRSEFNLGLLDEATEWAPGHEAVKAVVVNNFYNEHSEFEGLVAKQLGLINPKTEVHSYQPLKIFNEEKEQYEKN